MPAHRPLAAPNDATRIIRVDGLSNREFLEQYALAGRIGLSTGTHLLDKAIARAQRSLDADKHWGAWSHSFVFEGPRVDGHVWLVESDLDVHRKHIRLGAQENRITKYFDDGLYESLAVLDFGLTEEQARTLLVEALDLVADQTGYSLREILGIWFALHRSDGRGKKNVLERDRSLFCSALVTHLYRRAGLDPTPGLDAKAVAPDDLFRSTVPHTAYVLVRGLPSSRVAELRQRVRVRLRARRRQLRAAANAFKAAAKPA